MNKIEEVKKLKDLFDKGAINQDEFSLIKKKVLIDDNKTSKNKTSKVSSNDQGSSESKRDVSEDMRIRNEARKQLQNENIEINEISLIYAIQEQNYRLIELLLEAGANPNKTFYEEDSEIVFYPFLHASAFGTPEIIYLLANYKARINIKNADGRNAMFSAIDSGIVENVSVLIDLGVNIDITDNYSLSPLNYAKKLKRKDLIQLLLNSGAKDIVHEKDIKRLIDYEDGNENTERYGKYSLISGVVLSLYIWFNFNWITALITIIISIGIIFFVAKSIKQTRYRNIVLMLTGMIFVLIMFIPLKKESSTTNHIKSSETKKINSTNDRAHIRCKFCIKDFYEKDGVQSIWGYTLEPDGIGMVAIYSGDRYDLYCSEKCAKGGRLFGDGYTKH